MISLKGLLNPGEMRAEIIHKAYFYDIKIEF